MTAFSMGFCPVPSINVPPCNTSVAGGPLICALAIAERAIDPRNPNPKHATIDALVIRSPIILLFKKTVCFEFLDETGVDEFVWLMLLVKRCALALFPDRYFHTLCGRRRLRGQYA